MNLLAIDTSSKITSLAIMHKGKIVFSKNSSKKYGAGQIVSYLETALKKLKLKISCFDGFVIGAGPGSFTGLRISFSVIKALSLGVKKPVISIGSFYSLVSRLKDNRSKIAVITDARRNLIYGAAFKKNGRQIKPVKKENLYKLEDFLDNYQDYSFLTYDSNIREKALAYNKQIDFFKKDIYPRAKELLVLAKDKVKRKKFSKLETIEPIYVYPKDCQIRKI